MIPLPPTSTLFPYTTLFRSIQRPRPEPGSPITVAAKRNGRDIVLSVRDRGVGLTAQENAQIGERDRKSTRLNSSHTVISYAVFCLKKKKKKKENTRENQRSK